MKKEENKISHGKALVCVEHIADRINGQLFAIIESAGLPEKQEEAIKSLIRGKVWQVIENECVVIGEKLHTQIRDKHWEKVRTEKGSEIACPDLVVESL